jgi:hypothetical protein
MRAGPAQRLQYGQRLRVAALMLALGSVAAPALTDRYLFGQIHAIRLPVLQRAVYA